jgi:hypothetical protein
MKLFATWARFIGPKDLTDDSILWFHRRVEYQPLVAALVVAIVLSLFDVGSTVDKSLMSTLAQVLPVLYLAQVVDIGFLAQRLAKEAGPGSARQEIARRYVGITAQATLIAFLAAEGAALYGAAYGATTFTVSLSLATGSFQALDIALGSQLRGPFRPTALARMINGRGAASDQ